MKTRHGPPYSPLAVANWFVHQGLKDGKPVTPLTLMKLVYLAQGWYLGLGLGHTSKCNSLINSTIEAWKFGPVPPDVYHAFKHFRTNNVTKPARVRVLKYQNDYANPDWEVPEISPSDKTVNALLERIWQVYRPYPPNQLSAITQGPSTPWHNTWHNEGGAHLKGKDIPNTAIQEHFKNTLSQ